MKKKIKLNQLEVKSFVTNLSKNNQSDLMGGATKGNCDSLIIPTYCCTGMYMTINMPCDTRATACNTTTDNIALG